MSTNPPDPNTPASTTPSAPASRWAAGGWKPGQVTLFNALGLGKWKIQMPKFQPSFAGTVAMSGAQAGSSASGAGGTGGSGSGGTAGTATPPTNTSEAAWITALLTSLGAPQTQANINSLTSWIRHESTWPPGAANNPLNTTLSMGGGTNFNSVGVKNYPTAAIGIQATIQTLLGGYPGIVAALKSGRGLCGQSFGGEFSKWSGGGYGTVC